MKKAGMNASWNRLAPEQRLELARWLFEEKIGYEKALARAKKKFGYAGSVSGLRRFYKRTWEERLFTGSATAETMIDAVENAGASAERMRSAGMKVVARMFLHAVMETPEDLKQWGPLAKLLLQSEDNELRRQLKSEENELRRQSLEFARSRYQFDMVRSARKALPELQELEEARKASTDPEAWELEENRRLNEIVLRMFGDCTPELQPETPEEKANPELVRRRLAEIHRLAEERFARERAEAVKHNEELTRRYEEKQEQEKAARAAREAEQSKRQAKSEASKEQKQATPPGDRDDATGNVHEEGSEGPGRPAEPQTKEAPWEDGATNETPEERQRRSEELIQRAFDLRKGGL